jgi:hypothetical protein
MVAYEFYWHDDLKGYELIGILPERRKNPERINQESIMNWGKKLLGDTSNKKDDIFFIQITMDKED